MEAPEALLISQQLNETTQGLKITYVQAAYTPHKFTWYYRDPQEYPTKLVGKTIGITHAYGGLIEIEVEDMHPFIRRWSKSAVLQSKHKNSGHIVSNAKKGLTFFHIQKKLRILPIFSLHPIG